MIAPAQCREEAEKHQIIEWHDGDGREVETQQAHCPVVLQQVESLSRRRGLAAQDNHLNHHRQRVNDKKQGGDSANPAETAEIATPFVDSLFVLMF